MDNKDKEIKRLKNEINLLDILVDNSPIPPKCKTKDCDNNDCKPCVYRHYRAELNQKRDIWYKEREEEDAKDFADWKAAGRPKAE